MNFYFLNMFHNSEMFSVTESFISLWPYGSYQASAFLRSFMSVAIWEQFFPNLKEYQKMTAVDFRCGFNKKYLFEGGLLDPEVSKVTFKDDNNIEIDFHLGCSVYVLDKQPEFDLSGIISMLDTLSYDKDDTAWKSTNSVFISLKAKIKAEFGQDAKTSQGLEAMKIVGSMLGATDQIEQW